MLYIESGDGTMGILNTHKKIKRKESSELTQQLIMRVTNQTIAAMLLALNDEFGFGRKRMVRVMARACKICDSVNANHDNKEIGCSFEDIIGFLRDEYKIEL